MDNHPGDSSDIINHFNQDGAWSLSDCEGFFETDQTL